MREAHAGRQPPDPRPRREAGIGGPGCRCRTTSAGTTGVIPRLGRGDRRSLRIRVLSSRARQGSAAPIATPRRRAEPAGVLRPPRPASPTAVPASRSPLTRRQRSSRAPTPSAPQHSLKTTPENERCPRSSPVLRCLQHHVRTGIRAQCEVGLFRLIFSLENAHLSDTSAAPL